MKTILVPTQSIAAMKLALQVAVLLARRTGAYIEGFPLRVAIPPYVGAELTAGLTMDAYDAQRGEETAELRRLFETLMQEHGTPPFGTTADRPCSGAYLLKRLNRRWRASPGGKRLGRPDGLR
jgi:hypothetical protein